VNRVAWAAFVRRDWRIARSYRFPFAAGLIGSLFSITTYFFLSRIVRDGELPQGSGRAQGYFAFAVVGIVLVDVVGVAIYTVATRLREELISGTFEMVAAAPIPAWLVGIGNATYETLYGAASGGVFLIIAIILGARFELKWSGVLPLVCAIAATLVLTAALGIVVAAATVVVKQASTVASFLLSGLTLLSGVYYPIASLPKPLQSISWVSPFRWALDVIRPAVFGGHVPLAQLGAVVAAALITLPLSVRLFEAALDRVRRTGSLIQY
jgi:ABC-type polysaccharide/polyol phosphate export permease